MTPSTNRNVGDPAESLVYKASALRFLILAAQREGNRHLVQALREIDLTPAQAEVMLALDQNQPLTLAALGGYIVCEAASPSRVVAALARKGLIERQDDPVDRRASRLNLTPQAQPLLCEVRNIFAFIDAVIAEHLEGTDADAAILTLRSLLKGTPMNEKVDRWFPTAEASISACRQSADAVSAPARASSAVGAGGEARTRSPG